MLFHEEPAHVCEKESTIGIVRVGVGLGEFVMDSMIARPFKDTVLECHGLLNRQQETEWKSSLVRFVAP